MSSLPYVHSDVTIAHLDGDQVMGMHFKLGLYEHQSAGALEGLITALVNNPELVSGLFGPWYFMGISNVFHPVLVSICHHIVQYCMIRLYAIYCYYVIEYDQSFCNLAQVHPSWSLFVSQLQSSRANNKNMLFEIT